MFKPIGGTDDEEDMGETLASIHSAELMKGGKLGQITQSSENFLNTRNKTQNLMKDNERITSDMLEITERDGNDDKMTAEVLKKQAAEKKAADAKKAHTKQVKDAEEELGTHFNNDDIADDTEVALRGF